MNSTDRNLGMDRPITRRDFINGVAVGAGAIAAAGKGLAQDSSPEQSANYYPPALTGMRGSHPGSFEAAHQLRDDRKVDLSGVSHTNESYDLVIVGGGMSGLSSAYFLPENRGPRRAGADSGQSRRLRRTRQAE